MSYVSNTDLKVRFCQKCQAETERNKSGACKPCSRASTAAYRAANLDKVKATNAARYAANPEWQAATRAAYYAANKDRLKPVKAAYRAANPEVARAACAKWSAANPEAKRIHQQNRRARKGKNGGVLSKGLSAKLFKLQKGKCACCNQPLGDNFQLDHIMPLALGGTNTDDNVQLLRPTCNQQKHAKHPVDFMQQRGFLI